MICKFFDLIDGQAHYKEGNRKQFGFIVTAEDGYKRWEPPWEESGFVDAHHLIDLGNLINALNESWDTVVQNDPRIGGSE